MDDCVHSHRKDPDAVLTPTSRFRVRSKLEAHQKPPAHDTRTRVATGLSTTGKGTTTLTKPYTQIDRSGHTTPLSLLHQSLSYKLIQYSHQAEARKGTEYGQ